MKKRILSLITALSIIITTVIVIPTTASAATSGTCGDNLTWTLDDEGTLTISGTGAMTWYNTFSKQPWYKHRSQIKKIIIEHGVTEVAGMAFSNTSVRTIEISDTVEEFFNYATHYCNFLEYIFVDEKNPFFTSNDGNLFDKSMSTLFQYCTAKKETEYYIPKSVEKIEDEAFAWCENLENLHISENVKEIGMFGYCYSLKNIYVDPSNSNYVSIDGVLFNKDKSLFIRYPIGRTEEVYEIPNTVTTIGRGFSGCGLKKIVIPNSVNHIQSGSISSCDYLTDIYYYGSENDWKKITIDSDNDCLNNATIHYNSYVSSGGTTSGTTDGIKNQSTNSINLTIYQNKNDSSKASDSYVIASGATVTNSIDSDISDSKGSATVKNNGSDITVSKTGYLDRKLTASRAKKAKSVYLQKNTGTKPIIQAVWLDDTDVYTEDYEIDITSKKSVILNAEVVWKGASQKKIYLMQDAKRVEFNGNTLTTVLSDNFDVSETIYIVAEDVNGKATKKELKLKAGGGMNNALNDYKLSFGDSIMGTIPSGIPVIGGSKVGLDLPFLPLTVTFEDNKFYAVLGLDVAKASEKYSFTYNVNGSSKSKYEQTTKYLAGNIKDSFKKSADGFSFSKLKSKWMKAKYNYTATAGFEADLTVMGYVEGYVNSDKTITILDGGVGINPSIGVSVGSQIIPVPPLYWEATIKGEIEAMLNLYLNQTAKNFTPNGSIGGKVSLKGGVGIGASGVIGLSGGVDGSLGVKYDIYSDRQNYFALSGSIGAYVKAFAGPITFIDKTFPFAEGVIWDYPSTRVNMLSVDDINFYDTSEFGLIDRSYKEDESEFVANDIDISLFDAQPQNKIEKVLKTNVYTYSEPQLAEFSDGTMLAIWLDDDSERADINRTALYWSYYNGTVWSDPTQVENDGTGDYSPQVEVINDIAYVVWTDAKKALDNNAELSEVFGAWEISVSEFDRGNGRFINTAAVTDNGDIDMMPEIFGNGDTVEVAWVSNSSDDIFSTSNTYSVMLCTKNNGVWGSPVSYSSSLMPIDSIDGYSDGTNTYIAYTVDLDGNQEDYSDKEIYLNNARLTNNGVLDSKPEFANGKLYYYSNGTVTEYDLSEKTEKTVAEYIPTDRFSVISDGENCALVYGKTDSLVTELYAVIYDSATDKWGESIALTKLDSDISSFSGIFSENGDMKFVINKTAITGDINSENPYGKTDIAMFGVTPTYNLAIGDVAYHEDLLVPGNTLELYTQITNNGELTVEDYNVQVTDGNGGVLATTYGESEILPGETVDFTVYYPLGDGEFVPHDVTLVVTPMGVTDFDSSDNSATVTLTSDNVSVENIGYGLDEGGNAVISAEIVNRGYTLAGGVTATLIKGRLDGETIETVSIDGQLDTLDSAFVSFAVPYEKDAVYYIATNGKDSDFVVLQADAEGSVDYISAENKISVFSPQAMSGVNVIVASYSNNKMLAMKSALVDIAVGENKINSPITDFSGADEIRVMVWSGMADMKPLFEECRIDLTE